MKNLQWLAILVSLVFAGPAYAGKNAGGALVVHTNDAYAYSTGTACVTGYAAPASCEEAITRSDRSEGSAVWLLAAFPQTANPAVTVAYFGIDYDEVHLDPGSAYKFCGPAGTLEIPDDDWPYSGRGNSLAFGSAVAGTLFPFYVFRIDGGIEGSYFSTAANPTGGYASFVDDSTPPTMDEVTRFGTVRWLAAGSNDCPVGEDGGGDPDSPDGDGEDEEGEAVHGLDGAGEELWESDCILALLRSDLPMPPREPVGALGIESIDGLGRELGVVSVRRVVSLDDQACRRFPIGSRMVKIQFGPGTDEATAARQYEALPEIVAAQVNRAWPAEQFSPNDDGFGQQWHLVGTADATSCEYPQFSDSCEDIGVEQAWSLTRGNPNAVIAFMDSGADLQHPDLWDAWLVNWLEDDGDGVVELCDSPEGDIDYDDADDNGVADDILMGWHYTGSQRNWYHPRQDHGTSVAGILGGVTNNDTGVASVAGGDQGPEVHPGTRLIQFSVINVVYTDNLIDSFHYARRYGAQIYSSSVKIVVDLDDPDDLIAEAVASLADSMLFIQAAGNSGVTPMTSTFAKLPGVMAIGGYDCAGGRWAIPQGHWDEVQVPPWRGSDYGPELALLGPAGDDNGLEEYTRMVLISLESTEHAYGCTPTSPDSIGCFGGTSAAAPIVASVASLVVSYVIEHGGMPPLPPITPRWLRRILEHTAEDVLCDPALVASGCGCVDPEPHCATDLLGWDMYSGFGRIDAERAITLPVAVLNRLA